MLMKRFSRSLVGLNLLLIAESKLNILRHHCGLVKTAKPHNIPVNQVVFCTALVVRL